MYIGIDEGHSLNGPGSGAIGIVKETDKNRLVGKRLKEMLLEHGHKVLVCTCDKATSQNNQLESIVKVANSSNLDLFVSIHLNSFSKIEANGVETFVYKKGGKAEGYAKKVQSELVNRIKWSNRGVKEGDLYVVRKTTAPAILLELGFCTNASDMNKWNTENICKAIFKGITGVEYTQKQPETPNETDILFRVSVGAYASKENAMKRIEELKAKNIDATIHICK